MFKDRKIPQEKEIVLVIDKPPGLHTFKTRDILRKAGYSNKAADWLIYNHYVWWPYNDNWLLLHDTTWINFFQEDKFTLLAIQPGPKGDRKDREGTGDWPYCKSIKVVRYDSNMYHLLKEFYGW